MFLKICRLRDPENIRAVVEMRPAMMGFDFCRTRFSYMGELDEAILKEIPYTIRKVGLFVNESPLEIASVAGKFSLNSIQLDGETTPQDCELLSAEGLEVIKTFYISCAESFEKTKDYEGVCNLFIFKLSTTLDLSILSNYRGTTPFMLSMKMDNVEVPKINHQCFRGFDTAASCEQQPAMKDIESLKNLIKRIKDNV